MKKSARGLPFPLQLYDMLEDAERCGFDHIIAWISNGAGFRVHKPDDLVEKILPRYLNQQTKYKSFLRQLNMYEFKMLRKVPKNSNKEMYKGAFFHPMFIRGKRELSNMILRKSIIVHINTTPALTKKRRALNRRSTPTSTVGGSGEKEEDKQPPPSTQQLSYLNLNKENGITSHSTTSDVDVERVQEKTTSSLPSFANASSSSQHGLATRASTSSTSLSSYASSSSLSNSSYSELYFSKLSLIHGHVQQGDDECGRLEGFSPNIDANIFHPVPPNCMEPPHIGTTTTALTETKITETHTGYEDEDPASWEELVLFGFDGSNYDDVPYNIMHPIEDDDITMEIISTFEINNNMQYKIK